MFKLLWYNWGIKKARKAQNDRMEGIKTKFTGKTVADAVAAGLAQLHKDQSEVEYEVLVTPKKGFLGIGRRNAEIEMTVKQPAPQKDTPAPAPKQENSQAEKPKKKAQAVKPAEPAQRHTNSRKERRAQAAEETEQALRDLGYYLADITKQMGIPVTINVTPERKIVYYDFTTDKEGLLIGKHGKTLNSLQLLAQDFLDRRIRRHKRVMLNVANYRERRAETLERLAKKVARDAIAQGKPQHLDPMPSFERKVIHSTLADNEHVKTFSHGREPFRAVVVAPVD